MPVGRELSSDDSAGPTEEDAPFASRAGELPTSTMARVQS
jgi:hypothetical protein